MVTEIHIHPNYESIYNSDIALLRLQRPLIRSPYIKPVCLPWDQREFVPSSYCFIAGWGVNDMQGNLFMIMFLGCVPALTVVGAANICVSVPKRVLTNIKIRQRYAYFM